jgi:hydrogenase maturation protein HypF
MVVELSPVEVQGEPQPRQEGKVRLRLQVRGAVQGVGFRPFVYRLATEMGLPGWVNNSPQGVFIEVEGDKSDLDTFLLRLERDKPRVASIASIEPIYLDPAGYAAFEIRPSDEKGERSALILPDIATCPECLRDISDPANRRYLYPFTNCTNCGPRFSIIEALPYDRPNTTMKRFPMCEECRAEYENPLDRRFHAQPNACPKCGPHLELWSPQGDLLASHNQALLIAAEAVRQGGIVAVKGLGGFHLIVDARNDWAVGRLRGRKHREEKPLALMCPTLECTREYCEVSPLEERLLTSPESPIVLLRRHSWSHGIAPNVAPDNPYLGIMLPYTPLHHLLVSELGFPIVATSGNLSDEPICTNEHEALRRLAGIADLFLIHDRPIARHVDDSVVRIVAGRELVMRRARGYAPLPVAIPAAQGFPLGSQERAPRTILAVGAHLKNSIALQVGEGVFVSQHIGDLETAQATEAFRRVIEDFETLYDMSPDTVACDAHPDYLSTRHAESMGLPLVNVQHHAAHVYACMAENELDGEVLGVSWDGTGFGLDGTIWGGEFLRVHKDGFERVAHLRTFSLPGGEKAVREPRRTAIGLLHELLGDELLDWSDLRPIRACTTQELAVWQAMIRKGFNSPLTSSTGRLFDAVASILGVRQLTRFEGQAAMEIEFALDGVETDECYSFAISPLGQGTPMVVDWGPMVRGILADLECGTPTGVLAAKFHNTLAEMIVSVVQRIGEERVALTGGCFQNKYLTERAIRQLRRAGFRPYWHQRIPPNDGGIALGQLAYAHRVIGR